jgi:hypothetical protein
MSIITQFNNSFPMSLRGMANSTSANVVSATLDESGYEVCVCDGCDLSLIHI